jgi:hypothetical protein
MDSVSDSTKPEVVFEDYVYYAALQRRDEDVLHRADSSTPMQDIWFSGIFPVTLKAEQSSDLPPMTEDEIEHANASRAVRITSWVSTFYLLMAGIFGPPGIPYAISQLGWVPGVIICFSTIVLFLSNVDLTAFLCARAVAVFACYGGLLLWALFLKLDSLRYPIKMYGGVAERIFGKAAGHFCTFLQTLQLIVLVS